MQKLSSQSMLIMTGAIIKQKELIISPFRTNSVNFSEHRNNKEACSSFVVVSVQELIENITSC